MSLPPLIDQQIEAYEKIEAFINAPRVAMPHFVTHGYGGTGKTLLLTTIAQNYPGTVCAFTAKAASVISRKSGLDAITIHSAIYRFLGTYKDDRGRDQLSFKPRIRRDSWNGSIIYVDECSMVPTSMARDLIDTGARLVVMGDPGQLAPVGDTQQFFNLADFTLEKIHRQAWDSPIIRQSYYVRCGYPYSADGDDFQTRTRVEDLTHDEIINADVILCYRNDTRRAFNTTKRMHLYISGPPAAGEPIMCRNNSPDHGIVNGGVYTLVEWRDNGQGMTITLLNDDNQYVTVPNAWFEDFDERLAKFEGAIGFNWAYAVTVHKAQGSEYDRVLLIDEYQHWKHDRVNWIYTGITRASKSIIVVPYAPPPKPLALAA